MKNLFIGKKLHWVLIAGLIAVLYWLGAHQYHRVDYPAFLFILLGLAAFSVVLVLATYRRGDRITRARLDEDDAA